MTYHKVYCGHCGTGGHNRLGCPARKEEARLQPDGYTAMKLAAEREDRLRALESRACSYCREKGHNRSTCPSLKTDKQTIQDRQDHYQKNVAESLAAAGLATGSLFRIPTKIGWYSKNDSKLDVVAYIETPSWNNINFLQKEHSPPCTTIGKLPWSTARQDTLWARVVGTGPVPEGVDDDYRPPEPGDQFPVCIGNIFHLVKELYQPSSWAGIVSEYLGDTEILKIISPVYIVTPPPTECPLPTNIIRTFNLQPGPSAKDWEKERISRSSAHWVSIYPEEYKDFYKDALNES
jgi:hypothetical protein